MTRRTAEVTIEKPADGSENRDAGKRFLITEMDAVRGESWGIRAMGVMMRAGMDIDPVVMNGGLAGVALIGARALMTARYEESKPLLDEMMACVQIKEPLLTRPLLDSDIEEIGTRLRLRDEVINLHLGFSPAVVLLTAAKVAAEAAALASTTTRTSRKGSRPSSRRGSRRSPSSRPSMADKT